MQQTSRYNSRHLVRGLIVVIVSMLASQAYAATGSLVRSPFPDPDTTLYTCISTFTLSDSGSTFTRAVPQFKGANGIFVDADWVIWSGVEYGPDSFQSQFPAKSDGPDVRVHGSGRDPNNATWDVNTNSVTCP